MKFCLSLILIAFAVFGCVNGQWKGIAGYVDHLNGIEDPKIPEEMQDAILPSSGIPTVVISGYDKKDLMEKLASVFYENPVNVKVTDYEIKIDKEMQGTRNAMMYGSKYNNVPNERIVYSFATRSEKTVSVTGRGYIVTNPYSPYEKLTAINDDKSKKAIQWTLDKFKEGMEGGQ